MKILTKDKIVHAGRTITEDNLHLLDKETLNRFVKMKLIKSDKDGRVKNSNKKENPDKENGTEEAYSKENG